VRTIKTMLLANGHRLFRRGLEEILSSAGEGMEVLGEAQDDEEGVKPSGRGRLDRHAERNSEWTRYCDKL
jgi:DNA-binding NarL/FixJ family response regulator